jgi:hypothetical protein
VISRYLLIVLALGLAVYRASQGAWLPASGLFAMAAGLIVLKLSERRPALKPLVYLGFAITAATIVAMLMTGRR